MEMHGFKRLRDIRFLELILFSGVPGVPPHWYEPEGAFQSIAEERVQLKALGMRTGQAENQSGIKIGELTFDLDKNEYV